MECRRGGGHVDARVITGNIRDVAKLLEFCQPSFLRISCWDTSIIVSGLSAALTGFFFFLCACTHMDLTKVLPTVTYSSQQVLDLIGTIYSKKVLSDAVDDIAQNDHQVRVNIMSHV